MTYRHLKAIVWAGVVAAAAVACSSTSPSTTTTTVGTTTTTTTISSTANEIFTGLVGVQGSSFYSFTVAQAGAVSVTLASLTSGTPGPASAAVMGLGIGVPSGTDCAMTDSINAAPSLTVQLTLSKGVGTYCVRIFDVGQLTGPMNFAIRIVHT